MSGAERTPAEVVKDLRDAAEMLAQIDKYASGLICHTAADLIEQLTKWQTDTITWLREKRLLMEINGGEFCPADEIYTSEGVDIIRRQQTDEIGQLRAACDELSAEFENVEAALPDCPTCGGQGVEFAADDDDIGDACPDCVDGKVSVAQLAALWQAVHDRMLFVTLDPEDVWTPSACRRAIRGR